MKQSARQWLYGLESSLPTREDFPIKVVTACALASFFPPLILMCRQPSVIVVYTHADQFTYELREVELNNGELQAEFDRSFVISEQRFVARCCVCVCVCVCVYVCVCDYIW